MAGKKNLSLAEIIDCLENEEEDVRNIYIEPPDVAEYTDEDSADEDSGGMVENLTGRQLLAPAELVSSRQTEGDGDDYIEPAPSTSDIEPRPSTDYAEPGPSTAKKPKVPKRQVYKWTKTDLPDFSVPEFLTSHKKFKDDMSCSEFFELFFDDVLCDLLIDHTTKYALYQNFSDPKITKGELRCFFAVLIVSGYNPLPSKKSYWDSGDDMRNTLVYNALRRDRFIQIMRFIHAADNNNLDKNDKMSKLRPLMKILKDKFLDNVPIEEHLNYDESMIEYFGRHGCKQCIRNKPIRFGYKCWCLNGSSGYLANFEIYQGSIPGANQEHEKKYGKAVAPMLSMINELPENMKRQKLQFFFDNLFTGIPLLLHLKEIGYGGTGTVRQNRVPKECPIAKVKTILKKERGYYEFATQGDIVVARWMDNAAVTVASTDYKVSPVGLADRYSKTEKRKLKVPRPHLIAVYNQYMGGTDLMDAHVNNYRIGIRGKKWWWPIFTWLIDVSLNNAWILMRKSGKNMSQLDFRREIAQTYLKKYGSPPKSGGRPSSSLSGGKVLFGVRYDGLNHFPQAVQNKRRCGGKDCKTIGRIVCVKCDIGLCIKCFQSYHTL